MTKRVSVAVAKARLSEVIHEVEAHGDPIVIERRGRPVAVINRYTEAADGQGWFGRLYGCLADVDDFEPIMKDVLRSRRRAGTRTINLDRNRR